MKSPPFSAPLVILLILTACTSEPVRTFRDNAPLLPDLLIRRITYRSLGADQRTRARGISPQIIYEFKVEVQNAGNAVFREPFYISVSTRQEDYDAHQYGRHVLVNEAGAHLQPGNQWSMTIQVTIEYPRPPVPSFIPVRFYLNTEGLGTTSVLTVQKIPEHDYHNNVYELSLRTSRR